MRMSIPEVAREASTIQGLDAFWSLIHGQLAVRGASSALLGILASRRELEHLRPSRSVIWKSSHKPEFFEAFQIETLLDNDLTTEHCLTDDRVLLWHDPANWKDATPAQKKRANIERDLGLAVGFSVPSSHFYSDQAGGIGVAMPDVPVGEFDRFWRQEGAELVALCGILDSGVRGQYLSDLVRLSRREKDCLTWLAVGMRPDRIADRLGISDKSVEKYFAGARRKLKAATRDHAVAKAIMLGLIEP